MPFTAFIFAKGQGQNFHPVPYRSTECKVTIHLSMIPTRYGVMSFDHWPEKLLDSSSILYFSAHCETVSFSGFFSVALIVFTNKFLVRCRERCRSDDDKLFHPFTRFRPRPLPRPSLPVSVMWYLCLFSMGHIPTTPPMFEKFLFPECPE